MRAISATGSGGFTLLELLVVLTIVVLLAAAWPLASSRVFAAQHLRDESQQLAGAIRLAQMTARVTGKTQELQLTGRGSGWSIATESRQLPDGLTLSIRGESAGSSGERFLVFPDGSSSGQVLAVSFQGRDSLLRVLPVTGRLEIYP